MNILDFNIYFQLIPNCMGKYLYCRFEKITCCFRIKICLPWIYFMDSCIGQLGRFRTWFLLQFFWDIPVFKKLPNLLWKKNICCFWFKIWIFSVNGYLVSPPDTTTILGHETDNIWWTINWLEVDDWIVTQTQLVDIILHKVKMVLVAMGVLVTKVFRTPLFVVSIWTWVNNNNIERNLGQSCSIGISSC